MIYLLIISLVLLLFFVAYLNNFDMMVPAVWATSGFLVGAFVGAINFSKWGDIGAFTIFVILVSLAFFLIGSLLGKKLRINTKYDYSYNFYFCEEYHGKHLSRPCVIIMNIVMIITAILYLRFMYKNALIGGLSGGYSHIFSYARLAMQNEEAISMGAPLNIGLKISFGFAFVQTYIVLYDLIYNGKKSVKILDWCTILLYIVQAILSSGRTKMMYYVVFIATVSSILGRHRDNWSRASKRTGVKYIIVGVFLGLGFFWGIDQTVRGSVYGSTFGLWDQLSKYISSPIYALNEYLKAPTYMEKFEDTETLYPIISMLNKLGANYHFSNNALGFVNYGISETVITNIYTAARRYIHDFGYIGMCFFMFLEGTIYSMSYETIKDGRIQGLKLILYGILVYPVAFYFIEERFLNDLFTLTMIFQLICVIFFWKILREDIPENEKQRKWRAHER